MPRDVVPALLRRKVGGGRGTRDGYHQPVCGEADSQLSEAGPGDLLQHHSGTTLMIIEQHYDDEVLIDLLEEAEEDKHVPVCDTCTGTLESFRDLAGALHDDSVWDERELSATPKPETKKLLRAFAATTKSEDAAAGLIVAKLLAASADERTALLDKNPEWLNAGIVRRHLMHGDTINYTDPGAPRETLAFALLCGDDAQHSRHRIAELPSA